MKSHYDICEELKHALLVLRKGNDDLLDLADTRATLALNLADQKDADKIRVEVARIEKHYIGLSHIIGRVSRRERQIKAGERRRSEWARKNTEGKIYRGELNATDADGVTTMTDLQ